METKQEKNILLELANTWYNQTSPENKAMVSVLINDREKKIIKKERDRIEKRINWLIDRILDSFKNNN